MKGPQEQYTDELKKNFGFIATWLPGTPFLLGDIGILNDNVFTRVASLEDFHIQFDIREDDTADDLDYSSKGSVSVTTKFSGKASPQGSVLGDADAGFIVEFGHENAVLFKAKQTRTNLIKDTIKLGESVLQLYRDGKWNKNWVIITELVKAESATILISNSVNGKIELKASANIDAAKLDIADAKFEFASVFSKGMDTQIVSSQGLTPLFKVKGIKTRIFLPPIFKQRGLSTLDLFTPETAKGEHKDQLYFDYISDDVRE
ncbi:hypothetical protein [Mucilaginibacter psychrotolerans]|uniref:Uncharacterized protein n=1 Tax=Mucilaginibacter psychrotolerans TaxID=1524096 RepID=A0A4Y8SDV7_9SPHI|nr:hypothetical protein [Mucilaginibacter psychrotolerans]TFF37219.1 hypothetical protein E2R66_12320 [Mucilaginibacter psychrotolerans]